MKSIAGISKESYISIGLVVVAIGVVATISHQTGRMSERFASVERSQASVELRLAELTVELSKLTNMTRDRWTKQNMRDLNKQWRHWQQSVAKGQVLPRMPEVDDIPPIED